MIINNDSGYRGRVIHVLDRQPLKTAFDPSFSYEDMVVTYATLEWSVGDDCYVVTQESTVEKPTYKIGQKWSYDAKGELRRRGYDINIDKFGNIVNPISDQIDKQINDWYLKQFDETVKKLESPFRDITTILGLQTNATYEDIIVALKALIRKVPPKERIKAWKGPKLV